MQEAHAVVELVGLVAKLVGRLGLELLLHLRDERFVFGDAVGLDLVADHDCFHVVKTTQRASRIRSSKNNFAIAAWTDSLRSRRGELTVVVRRSFRALRFASQTGEHAGATRCVGALIGAVAHAAWTFDAE